MGRLVEMVVESVRVHMLSNRHVVILKDVERDRYLPIWIGAWEAARSRCVCRAFPRSDH
jgi:bifunctional DNase/RNase